MSDAAARLVLIDGSGYIFRAFFALPPLTRPDGTPVNAVSGFANMLHRLILDMPDDDLVVVFDAGKTSFRNELYADYKANRDEPPPELVPQFPLTREAGRAFGLPVIEMDNYEADDIIATLARLGREAGQDVLIVSSDKDLMQLVGEGVRLYDPMKGSPIDIEEVQAKFGVAPERVGDVLALAGDSSDNVPGVPGIGIKTAAQLINEFGDLEALLEQAKTIKQPKRRQNLIDHADTARLSRRLVALDDRVPIELSIKECARKAYDPALLAAFLHENGLRSLSNRIGDLPEPDGAARRAQQPAEAPQAIDPGGFRTLTELDALDALLAEADALGHLAFDCETTSLDVTDAELVGIALAVDPADAVYVPLAHVDDFGAERQDQPALHAVINRLVPVFSEPGILKIAHNAKYDLGVLHKYGVRARSIDDTMLLSYVLDGASHGHSLDELAMRHLGHTTIGYKDIAGSGKSQLTFAQIALDKATAYAAEDAAVTLNLHRLLKPRLIEERLVEIYETLERALVPVITAMEVAGIRVDKDVLQQLSADFTQRMAQLEDQAYAQAGRSFNLGSPKQLGEVLFDELGIAGGKKGKTGAYGTGADILEGLAAQGHALPQTVLDWRQLQKLTRTYTDALVDEIAESDGRVHTSYALAATSTGRLSSSEPNLQNIPIRTEEGRKIRKAFVPADGCVLLSADYSQIELRILAAMADIDALKDAFARGEDVHKVTASQMFGVPLDDMDPNMRRNAKTINYGIIYGIGAWGLAQRLGIEQSEAKTFIDAYFKQYPGIKDYMERAKEEARKHGYVRTLFGRRCYILEINAKLPARRSGAERAAINAPIQGTAADIMKRAMIKMAKALEDGGSQARMLLQVHDELVFEVPEDAVDETGALVREVMQNAASLDVPLTVDVGYGRNWDEAH